MRFCNISSQGTERGATIFSPRANGKAINGNTSILPRQRNPKMSIRVPESHGDHLLRLQGPVLVHFLHSDSPQEDATGLMEESSTHSTYPVYSCNMFTVAGFLERDELKTNASLASLIFPLISVRYYGTTYSKYISYLILILRNKNKYIHE